jgi:hypothetical protein
MSRPGINVAANVDIKFQTQASEADQWAGTPQSFHEVTGVAGDRTQEA